MATLVTDSLALDTSNAPWMTFALQELDKHVREIADHRRLKSEILRSAAIARTQTRYHLLDWDRITQQSVRTLGAAARMVTEVRNPEIAKYFEGLRTDPARDKKGRSWSVSPVTETETGWDVTAWCAAFVNWCLKQAGAPRLDYATAASWLRLGTPLPAPV